MSKTTFMDNKNGTIIKTLDTGEQFAYDILVGRNITEKDSILNYCYSQFETKLTTELSNNNIPTNIFCSGTSAAMILAITYADKNIIPINILYWGDDENNRKLNWIWEINENGKRTDKGLILWEQDNYEKNDMQVYDNRWQGENGDYGAIDGSSITTKNDYLQNIKLYLSAGLPVIIDVGGHFVVVAGVESNVKLDDATLDQLVIFDPNWHQNEDDEKNKIATMGESGYKNANYRMLTPYPIVDNPKANDNEEPGEDENDQEEQSLVTPDNTKLFVTDENGIKTHDPYYIDPVRKSKSDKAESIIPAKQGRPLKEAIKAVNNSTMKEDEKEEKIKGLIKLFTGEDFGAVYENLNVTENGEYEPEEGVTAFDKVVVDVKANVRSKGIVANGEYRAANEGVEGFNVVNVNVPGYGEGYLKGFSDAADKIREVEELEAGGSQPVDVPEDDDRGGGTYHFAGGAVKGLSEDNAGYIARQFKDGGYITDIVHGKIIKFGVEYDEQRSYEEWHLILELYDARTGELIQSASSYWADCRNWTGSNGNDELRISNVSAFSGFYMGISVYWYKYNAPSGYTRDSGKYVRWVNDNVKPQYVVSKTMPTYTAGE